MSGALHGEEVILDGSVANQSGWLTDATASQERTRAIADALADTFTHLSASSWWRRLLPRQPAPSQVRIPP
jgi:hypothetical protein